MAARRTELLLSLLLVAAHGAVGTTTTPVINATCAAVSRNSTMHTEYDYCVGALSVDPAASSATDARGLAAAGVGLTIANITSTEHIISDLRLNLGRCLEYYAEMKSTVARALDDVHAGLAGEASKKLLKAIDANAAGMCDLVLEEGDAMRDPMFAENHYVHLVSRMASDVTELLLRSQSHAAALSPKQSS